MPQYQSATKVASTTVAPIDNSANLQAKANFEFEQHNQWLYGRVFEDLQMYFQQQNALKYTNPLTETKWLTTPPIPMTVNGVPALVVACVEDDGFKASPISLFNDRCDGIPVGTLRRIDILTIGGTFRYSADGVKHANVDFEKTTGEELHGFTDGLTQYLIENPVLSKKEKIVKNTAKAIQGTGKGIGSALKSTGRALTWPVRSIAHGASAAWNYEHVTHYGYGNSRTRKGRDIAFAALLGLGGLSVGAKMVHSVATTPTFYDTPHELADSAAIDPNSDHFQKVETILHGTSDKLANSDEIKYLDDIEIVKNRPKTSFEEQIQPLDQTGQVYEAQIPKDGHCNMVQTFNIPKGTVKMVETEGAPKLFVRINREIGNVEDSSSGSEPERVEKAGDDTRKTELTEAQVCNPLDVKDVDFGTPDGEHAYLQFVKEAPVEVLR